MTVYFAQARTDQTSVKIGFTSDLPARTKNLSVSTPGGVAILATLPGNKETEEYLHDKFADHRLGGEWFRCSDEIRDFMRDIANGKQGLVLFPDTVTYMHRNTADFAGDALSIARQMLIEIINAEHKGVGDTIGAACYRLEARTGLSYSMMKRIRVRRMKDLPAGIYLHIKAIYDQLKSKRPSVHAAHQSPNQAVD